MLTSRPIRVMIVDDHEVVRAGVASVLSRQSHIQVVAYASSGTEALEALEAVQPDVVILDHRLPDMPGAKICQEMVNRRPSTSVIMLTSFDSDDVIHACLVAGARGYVTKSVPNGDLIAAVCAVAEGGVFLGPDITERVVGWARQAKQLFQASGSLAPEEVEVLGLAAEGLSNRQIAAELCMSESTVKLRLKGAMRKLGATRRLDAVAAGVRQGVI